MNNVKKTIGWADYTWNPIVGCKNNCFYCYAKKIHGRFSDRRFSDIHLYSYRLEEPYRKKKGAKIFVCSMSDFFGDGVSIQERYPVYRVIKDNPQHTFQLLTKKPGNITGEDFHYLEMFDNIWLGSTLATKQDYLNNYFVNKPSISVKSFISFEPLMFNPNMSKIYADWFIIGAMTGLGSAKYKPEKEWIENIVYWAKVGNRPVFMKDSIKPYWDGELLKEFPK
jgi:protein gp37